MPLSEDDVDLIEAFRNYVEGAVEGDDRYGPADRVNNDDDSAMASRFEAGAICWFEVAVHPLVPQILVGFATLDPSFGDEFERTIRDEGGTLSAFVGNGFAEAGLDWPDPPVEHSNNLEEYSYYATPLPIDDLGELDFDDIRGKIVRMLEGYLISFGPEIPLDEADEE